MRCVGDSAAAGGPACAAEPAVEPERLLRGPGLPGVGGHHAEDGGLHHQLPPRPGGSAATRETSAYSFYTDPYPVLDTALFLHGLKLEIFFSGTADLLSKMVDWKEQFLCLMPKEPFEIIFFQLTNAAVPVLAAKSFKIQFRTWTLKRIRSRNTKYSQM